MLVRFPSWYTLKVIGGSYLSSWTMIVPFLGYLVLLGSVSGSIYYIDITNLGLGELTPGSNESFFRLKLTFIGLSIIGFATIGFRLTCPREVAKYRDREDFILTAAQSSFPDEAKRKLAKIQRAFWYEKHVDGCAEARTAALIDANQTTAAKIHSGGIPITLARSDWLEKNQNSLNAIHSLEYELANYSGILVRYAIFVLYALGFLITLLPSLQVFWLVLTDVIASL